MTYNNNELSKIIKQRRLMSGFTLHQLSVMSKVSSSHLCRIEKGERFPSASILQKIAKPLGFSEGELLAFAGYLSPQLSNMVKSSGDGRLDPYVTAVLSQESVEVQRAAIGILTMLRNIAQSISK